MALDDVWVLELTARPKWRPVAGMSADVAVGPALFLIYLLKAKVVVKETYLPVVRCTS